ncbi:MAG: tail fiber domain-containing protein [Planctomycetota bacterium]|jgi:hypothetical protein
MKTIKMLTTLVLALGLMAWSAAVSKAAPMGTAFTYQGRLIDANSAADGLYDFQFKLFDDPCTGTQQGSTININDVDVIDGYFATELDFGSDVFDGDGRWLEVVVRPGDSNDPNAFVRLNPRQEITPVPYALQTRGIFVDDSGNVGIGTKSPEVPLQLEITENTEAFKITSGISDPIISLGHENSDGLIQGALHSDLIIRSLANHPGEGIKFQDSGKNDLMFIEAAGGNAGNIGIGTTNPAGKLHIVDSLSGLTVPIFVSNEDTTNGNSAMLLFRSKDTGGFQQNFAGIKTVYLSHASGAIEGRLDFHVSNPAGSIDTPKVSIQQNGYVGIGTENPSRDLHIYRDTGSANLGIVTADTSSRAQVIFGDSTGNKWTISSDNTDDKLHLRSGAASGTTRVTLQQNGNVGIGTDSPEAKLHIGGTAGVDGIKFPDGTMQTTAMAADGHSLDAADGSPTNVVYVNSVGNVGIGTTSPTQRLDVIGSVNAYRYYDRDDDSFYIEPASTSYLRNVYAWNAYASAFYDRDNTSYYVNPASTTSANFAGTVRAPTYYGSSGTTYFLNPSDESRCNFMHARIFRDLEDTRYFVDPGYSLGLCAKLAGRVQMPGVYDNRISDTKYVHINGDGELGVVVSSRRYKEDIAPLIDDFSKILQARLVTFNWKKSKDRGIGLIAEDMDELGLRNLVFYDTEGRPDGVRYEYISLYLLEVVKELKAENEALKEQLETQNESVNERLDALERIIRQSKLADVL